VLHFDEGHIDYQGCGQDRYGGITLYCNLLDLNAATPIDGLSDTQPRRPGLCQPSATGGAGTQKQRGGIQQPLRSGRADTPQQSLHIPCPSRPLRQGETYTVEVGDLADNLNHYTFVYDARSLWSPTVHVNQIGFSPSSKKYAYLSHWMGDFQHGPYDGDLEIDAYRGVAFHLIDQALPLEAKGYDSKKQPQACARKKGSVKHNSKPYIVDNEYYSHSGHNPYDKSNWGTCFLI
jgi:hypothetical protein